MLVQEQLLENIVKNELVLENPFIFFVKTSDKIEKEKIVYWFAYSFGKINNILWGEWTQGINNKGKFKIKGLCGIYDMKVVNQYVKSKKDQGFEYISQLTEDKIGKNLKKYIPEIEINNINRFDLTGKLRGNSFYEKFSKEFMHYISHNSVLTKKSIQKCSYFEECKKSQEKLVNHGQDESYSCNMYSYGDSSYSNGGLIDWDWDYEDGLT